MPRTLRAIEARRPGVVRAATGAGKSALVAEICRMRPDDRIVVTTPTQQLVHDLHIDIADRLGERVGQFYGRKKLVRRVTVCCNPSLPKLAEAIDAPDLLIADEAHTTQTPTYLDVITGKRADDGWLPRSRIGVTATPYRSDKSESLELFEDLIFDLPPQDAIRAGIVVEPVPVHPKPGQTGDINDIMIAMIKAERGPGVVDATNIADAQEFCELLQTAGVDATIVHSEMAPELVNRRKKDLDAGRVRCVVHVDMLSAGVDIPNIRWLGLRRKTGARVRFAQYIGRGLRAVPGKTCCRVLDPWDLWNLHSLDWKACLGESEVEPDDPGLDALRLADILEDEDLRSPDIEKTLAGVPVVVLDPAAAYVRRLRFSMECRGVIPFDLNPGIWRGDPVANRDLQRIDERMAVVNKIDGIPKEHYRALWIAYRAMRSQKRGTASDMIRILKALQWRGEWPGELEGVEAN